MKILPIGLFLSFCALANGQQTQHGKIENLPNNSNAISTNNLEYKTLKTKDEFDFYLKDTVIKNGYLEVTVPIEYATLLQAAEEKIRKQGVQGEASGHRLDICKIPGFQKSIGTYLESENRYSTLFEEKNGRLAMITAWNFSQEGAKIVIVRNFQMATIQGEPATLTYATDAQRHNGVWKALWVSKKGTQYELYVEAKQNDLDIIGVSKIIGKIQCP